MCTHGGARGQGSGPRSEGWVEAGRKGRLVAAHCGRLLLAVIFKMNEHFLKKENALISEALSSFPVLTVCLASLRGRHARLRPCCNQEISCVD